MATNRNPIVNAFIGSARLPATTPEHKVLVVGQSNSSNITSGDLVTEIGNSVEDIKTKFGAQEHITQMILAFVENNPTTRKDAIALNDSGTGVAATANIVFTGPATASGTIYISIASEYSHRLAIGITKDDSATVVGDALEAAVTADATIPVTAVNAAGTVTITAKNKGTVGNDIGFAVEGEVAGVGVTLNAMSGGVNDPSLTGLFDVIDGEQYNTIITPYYALSALQTELDNRFNVSNKVVDGIGIVANEDTFANHSSNLTSLDSRNIVYIANKTANTSVRKGGSILELPEVLAARLGAIRSLRLTEGANIAKYMVNGKVRGGIGLASIPYFNTPVTEIPLNLQGTNFSDDEITTLVSKGGTTIVKSFTGTVMILNEVLVVAKTTASNRLNFEDTLRAIRSTRFFRLKSRYSQHRLGSLRPNEPNVTQESFITDSLEDYKYFVDNDLIRETTVDGRSTKDLFIEHMENTLTLNVLTGTITDEFLADIVTQLLRIDETIIPSFN